jgi:multicomponent Na+:H+ antiporter subunit F
MNVWLAFSAILLLMLVPCGWVCLTTSIMERFMALQMAQILAVMVMLLLAEGFARDIYFDMALVLAVLSLASGLVYVRFLERWL